MRGLPTASIRTHKLVPGRCSGVSQCFRTLLLRYSKARLPAGSGLNGLIAPHVSNSTSWNGWRRIFEMWGDTGRSAKLLAACRYIISPHSLTTEAYSRRKASGYCFLALMFESPTFWKWIMSIPSTLSPPLEISWHHLRRLSLGDPRSTNRASIVRKKIFA